MDAHLYLNTQPPSTKLGTSTLVVRPSQTRYVEQMAVCHQLAYGYTPDEAGTEDLTAEKYRQHLAIFPEGQFMVLDSARDLVAGTTTNMLVDFNLSQHSPKSWAELTKDG